MRCKSGNVVPNPNARSTIARSWIGRKRRDPAWPAGRYRGLYRVEREIGGETVTVIDVRRDVEVR